jgi:hypothetical protein
LNATRDKWSPGTRQKGDVPPAIRIHLFERFALGCAPAYGVRKGFCSDHFRRLSLGAARFGSGTAAAKVLGNDAPGDGAIEAASGQKVERCYAHAIAAKDGQNSVDGVKARVAEGFSPVFRENLFAFRHLAV